jgi:transposase
VRTEVSVSARRLCEQEGMKWLAFFQARSRYPVPQVNAAYAARRRKPAMQHLAIDLGGRESQICIRNERGKILREARVPTTQLQKVFATEPPSRVVMETCSESFTVAQWARDRGHDVRIVPASAVRALGVGARGVKNDVKDAQVLSDVSTKVDIISVHIASDLARERKARCTAREALVKARTQLVNSVRSFLRQHVIHVRGRADSLPKNVREVLLASSDGVPNYVEQLLKALEAITEQIDRADSELFELATRDKTCKLLMTVPGIGPVTAMRFVAAIDDPARFPTPSHVTSYLGLTPGENTTGFKPRRTGITKAGPACVRRTLSQAAWCLWRTQPKDPLVLWAQSIADKRGKQKANIALCRKLAALMFVLWREDRPYNPMHFEQTKLARQAKHAEEPVDVS